MCSKYVIVKTDLFSVSDNFQDSPPPLPVQKPVGSLNSSIHHKQSPTPVLPFQVGFPYLLQTHLFHKTTSEHPRGGTAFYKIKLALCRPKNTSVGGLFFRLTYISAFINSDLVNFKLRKSLNQAYLVCYLEDLTCFISSAFHKQTNHCSPMKNTAFSCA